MRRYHDTVYFGIILQLISFDFFFFQFLDEYTLVAHLVKNLRAMQETQVRSLGQEDPWRREWLDMLSVFLLGKSHGERSVEGYSPSGHKSRT